MRIQPLGPGFITAFRIARGQLSGMPEGRSRSADDLARGTANAEDAVARRFSDKRLQGGVRLRVNKWTGDRGLGHILL